MHSNKQYRDALRNKFGDRRYRIKQDGTIEIYGTMPNTNEDGWYLYGDVGHAETEYSLFGESTHA